MRKRRKVKNMGLIDAFNAEDKYQIKYSELYALTLEATKFELLFNAVKCDVPHKYMREMISGNKEDVKEQEE